MLKIRTMIVGIIFSIFIGSFQVYAADKAAYKAEEIDALAALGIMVGYRGDNFISEAKMTRNEFTNMVCNLAVDEAFAGTELSDEARSVAVGLGLDINQTETDKTEMTEGEALKMVMDALGYKTYAALSGGSMRGYEKAAQMADIDLPDGYKAEETLTKGVAAQLLYEAISGKAMLRYSGYENGAVNFTLDKDITILSERRKIYKISGLVDRNNITALTAANDDVDDKFSINDIVYQTNSDRYNDLLGMNVTAWIKDDDNDGIGDMLIHAMQNEKKNAIKTIDLMDVDSMTADCRQLTYFNENDRLVTAKISNTVRVIYNEKAWMHYASSDFLNKTGTIILIDNDRDGSYDVAKINAYQTMVTESVYLDDDSDCEVVGKYTYDGALNRIKLEDRNYKITMDGSPIDLKELREWDVLDVYESKEETSKYFVIQVSRKTAEGTLQSFSEDSVIIEEKEYEITNALLEAIENKDMKAPSVRVASKYKIYLDCSGRIAAWTLLEVRSKYALLIKIYSDEELNYGMKILNDENDIERYDLATKIKYNGVSQKVESVVEILAPEYKVTPQVIEYTINNSGQVNSIRTAVQTNVVDDDMFTASAKIYGTYCAGDKGFDGRVFVDDDALIFSVLKTDGNDDSNYSVVKPSVFSDGGWYEYIAFNRDEYGASNLFLFYEDVGASATSSARENMFVVDSKAEAYLGDDVVEVLYGMRNGLTKVAVSDKTRTAFAGLKRGDVVNVTIDALGNPHVYKIYNYTEDASGDIESSNINEWNSRTMGYIQNVDMSGQRFIIGDTAKRTLRWFWDPWVYIYDAKDNRTYMGTINDLRVGDYAIVRTYNRQIHELVIIRR